MRLKYGRLCGLVRRVWPWLSYRIWPLIPIIKPTVSPLLRARLESRQSLYTLHAGGGKPHGAGSYGADIRVLINLNPDPNAE